MEEKGPLWAAASLVIAIGLFVMLGFLSVASYVVTSFHNVAIELPMLVVAGAVALLAAVSFTAVALSLFGLNDKGQALGLPDGSVRAIIALLLIVIFAIFGVHLVNVINETNKQQADLAKQLVTLVGTLVTSICSFYFGTRAVESATQARTATEKALITAVTPAAGEAGSTTNITIDEVTTQPSDR